MSFTRSQQNTSGWRTSSTSLSDALAVRTINVGNTVAKEDAMGMTLALGLIVLTVVAGCFLWTLLFHFEEFYPAAKEGTLHLRRARLFFLTITGLTTVAILAVLFLEFQLLVTS